VFFEGVAHLLLMVHDLLLLVLDEDAAVDSQDEGGGVVLAIVVELRVDELRRHGVALVFGTEEQLDVVLCRVGTQALQHEEVVLALVLAPPLPF
jgi:hypothetical protein